MTISNQYGYRVKQYIHIGYFVYGNETALSFVKSMTDDKRQALDLKTDSSYNIREGRKQLKSERKYKNMKKNIGKSLALYYEEEYWKEPCTLSYTACRSRNDGK